MNILKSGVIALSITIACAFSAQAVEWSTDTDRAPHSQPHMPVYGKSLPPIGYLYFCQANPKECVARNFDPVRVVMNNDRWQELSRINLHVNKIVQPVTDQELYNKAEHWTYPGSKGDCEDYVLLKRRYLINMGWPEQALLITVVRDQNNEGHAVLTVATDIGDVVLDNQSQEVLPWQDTPYRYELRQSQTKKNAWVSLNPKGHQKVTVATSTGG